MHLSHLVETIDTHTAGNPTRNLIAGVPRIDGKTMQDKMAYAEEHLDWLRTAVMMEPERATCTGVSSASALAAATMQSAAWEAARAA